MKPKVISRSWQVGRFTATLVIEILPDGKRRSRCDWHPYLPHYKTAEMEAEWLAGLHIAVASIRAETGEPVRRPSPGGAGGPAV